MAAEVAARTIPPELIERIVAQTDGVPLFIEELTRAVLETGLDDASRLVVPETLQASLMARLDRLPAAKTVAQIGAVIGRSFSHELLAAVAQLPEPALTNGLQQLVSSGLAFQRGTPPEASYTFKHALVQDTVYQSLLRSRRAALHGRVVEALRAQEPGIEESRPDLLAHHCEQAGFVEQAIDYWLKAGRLALARWANAEAITQLQKGLRLLDGVTDNLKRQSKEIDLQLALGGAFGAGRGGVTAEAGAAFHRARELCQVAGETSQLVTALLGLWRFHLNRSELAISAEAGEELLCCAEGENDAVAELVGHRCLAISILHQGALLAARTHAAKAISLHEKMPTGLLGARLRYPTADGIIIAATHSFLSWALLLQGHFEQAFAHVREALDIGKEMKNPLALGTVLYQSSILHQLTGNLREVEQQSAALIAIAAEQDFPLSLATGLILHGWCVAAGGDQAAGLADMRRGVTDQQAIGDQLHAPYYLGLIASSLAEPDPQGAMLLLADALNRVEKTGECWFEAELHRLQGEVLLGAGYRQVNEAESCFRRASAVAREQGAKFWELRAGMSLARLWCEQGRRKEAYDLLVPIYDWFTEGFDTPDLKEAQALLRELA
jgi:predicted ATPase